MFEAIIHWENNTTSLFKVNSSNEAYNIARFTEYISSKKNKLIPEELEINFNSTEKYTDYIDISSQFITFILKNFPDIEIKSDIDVNIKKVKCFIEVTEKLAGFSKCSRLKVCTIIVENGRIISTGINGTPSGFINCCDKFNKKSDYDDYYEKHHKFSEEFEIHAEMNALLQLGKSSSINNYNNLELYSNIAPCVNCAKHIAQVGIKKVFFHNLYDRQKSSINNLVNFGIEVYKV